MDRYGVADAIKEGDVDRVIRCWQHFLVIFRNSNRKNYAKEAVLFLHQYQYLLPPHLCEQVIYNRFVNISGLIGRNIPADLHMEHLNKLLRIGISALASNKTEKSITRLSKALGTIAPLLANYDDMSGIKHDHPRPEAADMIIQVINYIQQSNLSNCSKL